MAKANSNSTLLSAIAAIVAAKAHISTRLAEVTTDKTDTQTIESGDMTLITSPTFYDFAQHFYGTANSDGSARTVVVNRSDSLKSLVSQFRAAILTIEGVEIVLIGITKKDTDKEGNRIFLDFEIPLYKAFFANTDFLTLFRHIKTYLLNDNFSERKKPLTVAALVDLYPVLAPHTDNLKVLNAASASIRVDNEESYQAVKTFVNGLTALKLGIEPSKTLIISKKGTDNVNTVTVDVFESLMLGSIDSFDVSFKLVFPVKA